MGPFQAFFSSQKFKNVFEVGVFRPPFTSGLDPRLLSTEPDLDLFRGEVSWHRTSWIWIRVMSYSSLKPVHFGHVMRQRKLSFSMWTLELSDVLDPVVSRVNTQ